MKWFTYCSDTSTVDREKGRWRAKTTHKKPPTYGRQPAFGLLLHSDDADDPVTDDDVKQLTKDPLVSQIFPGGYFILPSDDMEGDVIITANDDYTVLPDQAIPETPLLRIIDNEEIREVNLRQRYNDCRSLVKAVGCTSCPDKGLRCITRAFGPGQSFDHANFDKHADDDTAKELFKNRKTKIGAFTYISPKLTIPEDHTFVPSYRHYADHDFSRIEENSSNISEANAKAADGRAFKKKQCSKCPLKTACSNYRSCAGAYPSDEEMTKAILASWETKLKEGPFEPWQFWAIARAAGRTGRYRKKSVTLQGLRHTRHGWVAEIWRSKCDVSHLTDISSYKELQDLFDLPDEERVKEYVGWQRPEDDRAVALYLILTEQNRSRMHRGGWGGDYYTLVHKRLDGNGVNVQFGGPRYMRYRIDVCTYADYRREIGVHFGVQQARIRPNAYAND